MATRLTVNGVSTTITPDTEQYERFMSAHRGKCTLFYQYDYRATDGTLFSTVAKTLKECRQRCDEWLNMKINNSK